MTTTTAGPLHMIRFHDPFRVSKRTFSPLSNTAKHLPTPAGPMSEVRSAYKPDYHQQEHAHQHSEHMNTYRSHAAPQFMAHGDVRQHNVQSSPVRERKPSAIATNFQIPRAVNDSGGSLAELAAQVRHIWIIDPLTWLMLNADNVFVLVRIFGRTPRGCSIITFHNTSSPSFSRRQTNDRLPEMGHDHIIHDLCSTKRCAPGPVVHIPTQKAKPKREGKAWKRISIAYCCFDVGKQVPR